MSISAAFSKVAKWQSRVGRPTPLPTFCAPCCCETQWSLYPLKRCSSYAPRVWLWEQIKAYSLKTLLVLCSSSWKNWWMCSLYLHLCFCTAWKHVKEPSAWSLPYSVQNIPLQCLWCLCCAVLPVQHGLQACAVLHRSQALQETQPALPYRGDHRQLPPRTWGNMTYVALPLPNSAERHSLANAVSIWL